MKWGPGLPDRKRSYEGEIGWITCRSLRVFDPDRIYQSGKSSTPACTPANRKTRTIRAPYQPSFTNTGIQVFSAGEMVPTLDKIFPLLADFLKRDNQIRKKVANSVAFESPSFSGRKVYPANEKNPVFGSGSLTCGTALLLSPFRDTPRRQKPGRERGL